MRSIEVENGLVVRFPNQDPAFIDGVEIGLLLADLAIGLPNIVRSFGAQCVDQAEELAASFGYRSQRLGIENSSLAIVFTPRSAKPKLRLISR